MKKRISNSAVVLLLCWQQLPSVSSYALSRHGSLPVQSTTCAPLNSKENKNDESIGEQFEQDTKVQDSLNMNEPSKTSSLDDTQRRIEQQQQQIDMLVQLVQKQQEQQKQSDEPPPQQESSSLNSQNVAPLKAMLFIDGTWLYYSIHERSDWRCPITKAYGRGWQTRYTVDWAALPRIVCERLQNAWDVNRPVELVRVNVYTSVKKDTSPYSSRMMMFQDMRKANFDVYIMETVGQNEKCIDIQLAVEMLHYATVPNAYDVAILLSGDKDFLPALIRTRQKGRKVGIVSMRSGCNVALYETDNAKDYDVIWLEDYLDQLMIPKENANENSVVSIFTLSKVLYDFIEQSGLKKLNSRDVGRYLKDIYVGDKSLLTELKECYGGLYQFLTVSSCFDVFKRTPQNTGDPTDKAFWVGLHEDAEDFLLEEAKRSTFSPEEKEFFSDYSLERLNDRDACYTSSLKVVGRQQPSEMINHVVPGEVKRDYTKYKVAQLKDICRERGLPVSGTKAMLIERIQNDDEAETTAKRQKARSNGEASRPDTSDQGSYSKAEQYLKGLICEYIQARGGQASSRDVGRYLAANAASGEADGIASPTALSELKNRYGGLGAYLANRRDLYIIVPQSDTSAHEFQIELRNPNQ